MNDRYLFRGKRMDNGEWIVGSLAQNKRKDGFMSGCYIMPEIFVASDSKGELLIGGWYEVISDTVGQCTGLRDRNGKLIFEGDILNEDGYYFVVAYDQPRAKFKLQHDGKTIQYPEWNRGLKMEIIDNIYNNPTLTAEDADGG